MTKASSDALGLDENELMKLRTADKIQKDHGKIPLELAGKNPDLEPIDRVWKYLSKQHKDDLIAMAETFAQLDRKAS